GFLVHLRSPGKRFRVGARGALRSFKIHDHELGWSYMRNLAIARAGEQSHHPTWLSDTSRKNFDLFVAYYGDTPGKWREGADFYDHTKGLKYPWFYEFLQANTWVLDYDAIFLADDDLEGDTATV